MKRYSQIRLSVCISSLFLWSSVFSQVTDEDQYWRESQSPAKAIDFSTMFKEQPGEKDAFEALKRQKELKIREKIAQPEAIETTVNPKTYIVGPGDVFSFNVWGPMEVQIPTCVNPEGNLLVPSVGELPVSGRTLSDVQREVIDRAKVFYDKSTITLSLESLRFFRVHVVGEVKYPGIYISQAMTRVTDLLAEAGGLTEWAWKRGVELRRADGGIDTLDIDAYEQFGTLAQNRLVNGGDVIYIPPVNPEESTVTVEGNIRVGGIYQIHSRENGLAFLQRIRALNKNTDLTKIYILRTTGSDIKNKKRTEKIFPFQVADSSVSFEIQSGDRIVMPSEYVYVRGAVMAPGAFAYAPNMRAKDYAGMAGGDYRSGSVSSVKVFHVASGKTEKGPNVLVEPGDVINLGTNFDEKLRNYIIIIPTFTSLILAAKAAGMLGSQ